MNYALIGCGRISTNHVKAALENELNIVGMCDIFPERIQDVLNKNGLGDFPKEKCFTEYKKMLDQVKPELVAIATESGNHAEIALYCIEKGINLIIEKPIAMSLHDAKQIILSAKEHGVQVSACHQNRFNIAVQETQSAVEAGRFGAMSHGSIHVRWNRGKDYYEQAPWRGTWEQDGGCLMNQCIHGIDLLRWLMGNEVEEVYGQTRKRQHPYLEAEDIGMAVIRFKNGSIATVEGTTNVFPQNLEETLYLFGENGTVKIGGRSTNHIDVWQFKAETSQDDERRVIQESVQNVYGNGHTSLYKDVVSAILEKRAPYVDAQAGYNALELVLAIYKSQQTGLPVKFPLDDFQTMDMAGMFD